MRPLSSSVPSRVAAANRARTRPWTAHASGHHGHNNGNNGENGASHNGSSVNRSSSLSRLQQQRRNRRQLVDDKSPSRTSSRVNNKDSRIRESKMVSSQTANDDTKRGGSGSRNANGNGDASSSAPSIIVTDTAAASIATSQRRDRGAGGGGQVGDRHTGSLVTESDVPLYRIAAADPRAHLLTRNKVRAMLDQFGQFPDKHRLLLWRLLLQLPENKEQYTALVTIYIYIYIYMYIYPSIIHPSIHHNSAHYMILTILCNRLVVVVMQHLLICIESIHWMIDDYFAN